MEWVRQLTTLNHMNQMDHICHVAQERVYLNGSKIRTKKSKCDCECLRSMSVGETWSALNLKTDLDVRSSAKTKSLCFSLITH